jgi:hypothetical protein
MPRRLAIRLGLALLGLVVALVGGLAVLIAATSAPVLPPPPLPTATAQPGPQATSIVSAPVLPPPPLPTATATPQPAPLAQPGIRSGLGADPNGAVRSLIGADPVSDIAAVDTVYRDSAHPRATNPPCDPGGQWSLQVDPENVVGYPYSRPPSAADWVRAATVVDTVTSLCPAPIVLSWYAHDKARPSSDRWTALLPSTLAASIDGPTLRSDTLAHARQP